MTLFTIVCLFLPTQLSLGLIPLLLEFIQSHPQHCCVNAMLLAQALFPECAASLNVLREAGAVV